MENKIKDRDFLELEWQKNIDKTVYDKEKLANDRYISDNDLKRGKTSMWAQIGTAAVSAAASMYNGKKNRKAEGREQKRAEAFEREKILLAKSAARADYRNRLAYEKASLKLQDKYASKQPKQSYSKPAANKQQSKQSYSKPISSKPPSRFKTGVDGKTASG